jgi:hypothetical protein
LRRGRAGVFFSNAAGPISRVVHSLNVAHGDVKPEAFLRDPCSGHITLIDFNLTGSASEPVDGGHQLSGTPGWVLNDALATRREHGALVGLATLLGWLLGVAGLGDRYATFSFLRGEFGCRRFCGVQRNGDSALAAVLGRVADLLLLTAVAPPNRRRRTLGRRRRRSLSARANIFRFRTLLSERVSCHLKASPPHPSPSFLSHYLGWEVARRSKYGSKKQRHQQAAGSRSAPPTNSCWC